MQDDAVQFDIQLNTLKNIFNDLYEASNDVTSMFETLDSKIRKLHKLYKDLMKTNRDNKLFVFGLDSFNFQTLAIQEETAYLVRFRNLLYNRIYADYLKLNKLVMNYVKENFDSTSRLYNRLISSIHEYPKYDYLNIYKYYDFELINMLFQDIVGNIQYLNDHFKSLQMELQSYRLKGDIGLNINNFVYSHEYMNNNIKIQIKLFLKYTQFFLNLHTKYLTNFITNIKFMHARLQSEINLDEYAFSKNVGTRTSANSKLHRNETLSEKERTHFDKMLENTDEDNVVHRGMSMLIRSMSPTRVQGNNSVEDYGSVIDNQVVSDEENDYNERNKNDFETEVYERQGEKHKIVNFKYGSDNIEMNDKDIYMGSSSSSTTNDSDVACSSITKVSEEDVENVTGIEEDIQLVETRSKKRRKRKKKKKN